MNIHCMADNPYINLYLIFAMEIKYFRYFVFYISVCVCVCVFFILLIKELKGENKLTA